MLFGDSHESNTVVISVICERHRTNILAIKKYPLRSSTHIP